MAATNVSDLREGMFCSKGAEIGSHQLPPSRVSLHKHILRANYQAYMGEAVFLRWRIFLCQKGLVGR